MTDTTGRLPERPLQPTYYASADASTGKVAIYLHQTDDTWIYADQSIDARFVPTNLRKLAVTL